MTARFKKVHHVSLMNESEGDEDENFNVQIDSNDKSALIGEDELAGSNSSGEVATTFSPTASIGKRSLGSWKFWKKERRYQLTEQPQAKPTVPDEVGREVTLCGKTFHICRINSWRVVFLVLFVFSVSITISVILSKLLAEPPGSKGAVVSDAGVCATLAADILHQNGTAVDAAITAMLCNGAVQGESSGLGGGGFMVVHLSNGSTYAIDFRETAPAASTEDMFHGDASVAKRGGLSVAVPGELKGMARAHQLFGRLPWSDLVRPVIDLCRNGFELTTHTASALEHSWDSLSDDLHQLYSNADGSRKEVGDLVQNPVLADTLEAIAANGTSAFYSPGKIAQSIVDTVVANGGNMTLEDLQNYDVRMTTPLQTEFNGLKFFSPPSPSGGPMFLFILSLLERYHHNSNSNRNLTYHRLIEAFKFGFAERTSLGDPYCVESECVDVDLSNNSTQEDNATRICEESECVNISLSINSTQEHMFDAAYISEIWSSISDDHTSNVSYYHPHYSNKADSGTSHISILSFKGDAVAVTTTVNTNFGADIMTDTGIVLNDEMDDFSSPNIINAFGLRPSPANFIRPNKRPLSSTCPTIAVSETGAESRVRMILGGAGGSQIPTSVVQAVLGASTFQLPLSSAIEMRRVHHQLLPNQVYYESDFSQDILDYLQARGHEVVINRSKAEVQGILVGPGGEVSAHADSRKSGQAIVVEEGVRSAG